MNSFYRLRSGLKSRHEISFAYNGTDPLGSDVIDSAQRLPNVRVADDMTPSAAQRFRTNGGTAAQLVH